MPKHDYEDYDDDGDYDDGYEETLAYVKKVKVQLKLPKITDAQIIRKLEDTDYNIDKTVKFFKDKELKALPVAVGAKATVGAAKVAPQQKGAQTAKPAASLSKPAPASGIKSTEVAHVDIKLSSLALETPVAAETVFHSVKGELALSDDEEVPTAKTASSQAQSAASERLPQLTMVVTGHVDAGKSTLIGHLLYKCGQVAQRTMHKYEKDSKSIGKASFALAWVTDDSKAEREHGVTIDVSERYFLTFTVLSARNASYFPCTCGNHRADS